MLALLLAARNDEAAPSQATLSDQEIHDNCVGLFGAGHDTSATALIWWIGLMAVHPEWVERVREETSGPAWEHVPDRQALTEARCLTATLKEAMRLYPPSSATFSRRAVRDVSIGGVTLARNALVIVPIWSMHRDPRWFSEPEAFKPERFLPGAADIPRNAFMPFSVGPHFCLGQQFAMVEMAVIAARLVRQFDWSLLEGSMLPAPVVDLVLKPSTPLNVCFKRR
jgi:cytochrome P450